MLKLSMNTIAIFKAKMYIATIGIGVLIMLATAAISPAYSDTITRHCDAKYTWATTGGTFSGSFARFKGRGSCGRIVPNRCRTRAADNAMRCMGTHWKTRWEKKRPELCYSPSGVIGYNVGLPPCRTTTTNTCLAPSKGVPKGDIKLRLETAVCCGFGKQAVMRNKKNVHVRLSAQVSGDKKCRRSTVLSSDYVIKDCSKIWNTYCKQ
jgi:hypothetical protein